ncbi:MAG: aspartate--tRNA(Asn) ligase [Candidatus Aenigmarchaeota archaeon]|nr:aspartate--tRNA(Asn) ligase [Candidatus Aenigmarchaeota archaeon]
MLRTHRAADVKPDNRVIVGGWVHDIRNLGKLCFVLLRDQSGLIQITAKKGETPEELFTTLHQLKKESVILVAGSSVQGQSKAGVELIPERMELLSDVEGVLPMDMSLSIDTTLDTRLDARSVDLRREHVNAIFKVQSKIVQEMQTFLAKNGFMQVFTPCLMSTASESGSEVFSVNYFKTKAYLRQDPQLHRQLTIAGGFEKIYDIGTSFRAELSHTTRHICEHRACAVELAFIKDEYDVMEIEQDMMHTVLQALHKEMPQIVEQFNAHCTIPKKFPVIEFPQIYDIFSELGFQIPFGTAYGSEEEKALGTYVKEKFNSDIFFVNKFPFEEKPFYVMRYEDDPRWARSTDMIFKGVELSSGGQREHRYHELIRQVHEKKISPESVAWFTDFFKYGVPPHGGFAIGIERLTMQFLNLTNVREAVLFPRDTKRLSP